MIDAENNGRYAGFGIGEFVCDASFQNWIIDPDGESNAFWDAFLAAHPEKTEVVAESRMLLEAMRFPEDLPEEEQVQQSLASALSFIRAERPVRGMREPVRRMRRWYLAAAAAAVAAGIIGVVWYYGRPDNGGERVATGYGIMKTIYLPDSSKLVLNAHSTVRYADSWSAGKPREVWLDGEAYFDVRKQAKGAFLVHTKALTVEVLGTVFDIRERRGKTEVVLQSGKIRVRFVNGEHEDLLMNPGEEAMYDPGSLSLTRVPVAADHYTSWKDKRLTDVTVGQIAEYLEDNYGKKVILEDPSMAAKGMGGTVLLDNLDDALFALSTVLNVNIIQRNDTLILKPR